MGELSEVMFLENLAQCPEHNTNSINVKSGREECLLFTPSKLWPLKSGCAKPCTLRWENSKRSTELTIVPVSYQNMVIVEIFKPDTN